MVDDDISHLVKEFEHLYLSEETGIFTDIELLSSVLKKITQAVSDGHTVCLLSSELTNDGVGIILSLVLQIVYTINMDQVVDFLHYFKVELIFMNADQKKQLGTIPHFITVKKNRRNFVAAPVLEQAMLSRIDSPAQIVKTGGVGKAAQFFEDLSNTIRNSSSNVTIPTAISPMRNKSRTIVGSKKSLTLQVKENDSIETESTDAAEEVYVMTRRGKLAKEKSSRVTSGRLSLASSAAGSSSKITTSESRTSSLSSVPIAHHMINENFCKKNEVRASDMDDIEKDITCSSPSPSADNSSDVAAAKETAFSFKGFSSASSRTSSFNYKGAAKESSKVSILPSLASALMNSDDTSSELMSREL
jgi:hypothetical protein